MKICVVQQSHNPGRVGENLSKALAFAKQALDGGSEIVLFHEELLVDIAFYAVGSLVCLCLIFIATWFQYNATYLATYVESGVRRCV